MISFYKEGVEVDVHQESIVDWIMQVAQSESKSIGEISYVFCDDEYLLGVNQKFLNHDTYTDIISFDYTIGNELSGDIFISIERVMENANAYKVFFEDELRRVMVHGVLHFCGYKDKTPEEQKEMRVLEDRKLKMFHVER